MVTIEITSCIDCPDHEVISDPDPHDWFCDDDMAVVCKKTPNPNGTKPDSKYCSDYSPYRYITRSCRPYNLRKETNVPDWCPRRI